MSQQPSSRHFWHQPVVGTDFMTVIYDHALSTRARVLYVILAHHWALGYGSYDEGHEDLAAVLGCSPRQLQRNLGELVKARYIIGRPNLRARGQAKAYGPGYTQQSGGR